MANVANPKWLLEFFQPVERTVTLTNTENREEDFNRAYKALRFNVNSILFLRHLVTLWHGAPRCIWEPWLCSLGLMERHERKHPGTEALKRK